MFNSAGTRCFGSASAVKNSIKSYPVYESGRNGKSSIVAGAAVAVVAAAVILFVLFRSSSAEPLVEPVRVLKSDAEVLTKLSLSKDGNALAAASANGDVIVWQLPGRRSTIVGKATGSATTMLKWSPDGLLLCGDSSGLLRGWQQPELKESRIDSPQVPVTTCLFRQNLTDKLMLLGLSDGRIVQIEPSGTKLRDSGHRSIKAMLISSDQSTLVSAGSEGKVIWHDFKQDKILSSVSGHDTEIAALAWSPNGTKLVSADWNGELRIWDAKKRKLIASATQPDAVSDLAWTKDRIVTGSWDGRIRVWNAESNPPELSFSIYTGLSIHSLVVDSSGETAFTGSGDGSVREWDLTKPVATE